jgi:hypothetical protein
MSVHLVMPESDGRSWPPVYCGAPGSVRITTKPAESDCPECVRIHGQRRTMQRLGTLLARFQRQCELSDLEMLTLLEVAGESWRLSTKDPFVVFAPRSLLTLPEMPEGACHQELVGVGIVQATDDCEHVPPVLVSQPHKIEDYPPPPSSFVMLNETIALVGNLSKQDTDDWPCDNHLEPHTNPASATKCEVCARPRPETE